MVSVMVIVYNRSFFAILLLGSVVITENAVFEQPFRHFNRVGELIRSMEVGDVPLNFQHRRW